MFFSFKNILHQLLRGNVHALIPFHFHFYVRNRGTHCEEEVTGESPRGRRPCEESCFWLIQKRKNSDRRPIRNILVSKRHFKVTQRRRAPRAHVHGFLSFVNEPFVMKRLERPPDAFHKIRIHRPVIPVHIHPSPRALHSSAPFFGITLHGGAAAIIEPANALRLDILLTIQTFLLFHEIFDGQPVAIPPEAPVHSLPPHRLVARDHVFDRAREQMPVMRESRGERRTIVERKSVMLPARRSKSGGGRSAAR